MEVAGDVDDGAFRYPGDALTLIDAVFQAVALRRPQEVERYFVDLAAHRLYSPGGSRR